MAPLHVNDDWRRLKALSTPTVYIGAVQRTHDRGLPMRLANRPHRAGLAAHVASFWKVDGPCRQRMKYLRSQEGGRCVRELPHSYKCSHPAAEAEPVTREAVTDARKLLGPGNQCLPGFFAWPLFGSGVFAARLVAEFDRG